MRIRLRLLAPVAMAVLLLGIAACGDDPDVSSSGVGVNTPDIQATVTALALSQARVLSATPVPAESRIDILAFAAGHQSTSDAWDQFHLGMDQWREDVVACVPSSVGSSLDTFASQALGITQAARSLDRLPNLESLADRLTAAAEGEAAAFEALKTNWTPSNSSESFQQLAAARAEADLERGNVSRALLARQTNVDDASRNLIEVFSSQLATLNLDWDEFHRDYDAFRETPPDPEAETPADLLGGLLTRFGGIVDQARKLPNTTLTEEIAESLASAADGEQLLLRRLLSADGSVTETVIVLPESLVITGEGETDLSGIGLSGATVYDVFDSHVASVNRLRRNLRSDLDDARLSLTEVGQENLANLLFQTRFLALEWDTFHDGYDEWRRTNGGCDQGQALETLGNLASEFNQTVKDIQGLNSGLLVRDMGEQLLQAAEREQAAVLSLRDNWRSLDTIAFGRYTADRSFSATLRRQAALDLQDLLSRQGIDSGS